MKILYKLFFICLFYLSNQAFGQMKNNDEIKITDLSMGNSFEVDTDLYFIQREEQTSIRKKTKKAEFKIVPSEDLYKLFEDNNYRILETLKNIDLTRPPIKTELKIRF